MTTRLNPHISVDCIIFGFDSDNLKVLLLKRAIRNDRLGYNHDYKLPGSLINNNEDLDAAANRVLKELTGLSDIYLKQLHTFGKVDRIDNERDLKWFEETYNMPVHRVVTVAYYSLIKIDLTNQFLDQNSAASWYNIDDIKELAFDHNEILQLGLKTLRDEIKIQPIVFELLPKKFSIRQLQNLYEIILAEKLDNRNFRKKMEKLNFLYPLEEKEVGVAHKPARLYRYNKKTRSKYKYQKDFLI